MDHRCNNHDCEKRQRRLRQSSFVQWNADAEEDKIPQFWERQSTDLPVERTPLFRGTLLSSIIEF